LRSRREEILEIARRYGASQVRVFGSVARGEANAESDIDFLVKFEPTRSLIDQRCSSRTWRRCWNAPSMWCPRMASIRCCETVSWARRYPY